MAAEKNFENKIKNMLRNEGAYFVKFFANAYTKSGVPDILACVNGYFVGIEVKAENGHPSDLQIYNIEHIRRSGGFGFVVYPSGFYDLVCFIQDLKRDKFTRDLDIILR